MEAFVYKYITEMKTEEMGEVWRVFDKDEVLPSGLVAGVPLWEASVWDKAHYRAVTRPLPQEEDHKWPIR